MQVLMHVLCVHQESTRALQGVLAALTAHRENTKAVRLRPAAAAHVQLASTARELERRQNLPAALRAKRANGREARGSPSALTAHQAGMVQGLVGQL